MEPGSYRLPRLQFQQKTATCLGRDDCINKKFLKTTAGLLKIGQTITLTTSIVSLARYVMLTSRVTPIDCVFFGTSVLLCLGTVALVFQFLFRCHEKLACKKDALNVAVAVFLGISSGLMLITSIFLTHEALKVAEQMSTKEKGKEKICEPCSRVNTAAVFGYLTWIIFAVDFLLLLRSSCKMSCRGVHTVAPAKTDEIEHEQTTTTV